MLSDGLIKAVHTPVLSQSLLSKAQTRMIIMRHGTQEYKTLCMMWAMLHELAYKLLSCTTVKGDRAIAVVVPRSHMAYLFICLQAYELICRAIASACTQ